MSAAVILPPAPVSRTAQPSLRVLPDPLPASGDPGLLAYLSASRLKAWQTCRRQFYFRYVARVAVPTAPALFIGTQIHEVLKLWNWARWKDESPEPAALRERFEQNWRDGLAAEPDIAWETGEGEAAQVTEQAREHAWDLLETYFAQTPIGPEEKPEGVEVEVQCELVGSAGGGILPPLKGIIDLVRPRGVIVDYKTAARMPDPALAAHQHETQLACYALLYREATGERETGFELHHLIKTKQPKVVITTLAPLRDTQVDDLHRLIEDYLDGIAREAWIASPGQHCGWCDHFESCRNWRGGET